MSSGLKTTFNYYCNNETAWIIEERNEESPPTQCKNDVGHTIKIDSIHIECNNALYCNVKPMTGTSNAGTAFDTSTATLQNLAERLFAIEQCAIKKGLLKPI